MRQHMVDFNFLAQTTQRQRQHWQRSSNTDFHTHSETHTCLLRTPLVANSFSIFSLEIEFQSYYKYFSGKCNFNGISPTLYLRARIYYTRRRCSAVLARRVRQIKCPKLLPSRPLKYAHPPPPSLSLTLFPLSATIPQLPLPRLSSIILH